MLPQKLRKILLFAVLAVGGFVLARRPAPSRSHDMPAPLPEARAELSALTFDRLDSKTPAAPFVAAPHADRIQTPLLPPAFSTYAVVTQDERPGTEPAERELRRIIRAPFKFPWLRIRSVVRGGNVITEEAVVADQLLVTLQPEVAPAALDAVLKAENIRIREKLHGSDTLLLQLPGHELDSVDHARARLETRGDLFRSVDTNGVGFGAAPNDPRFNNQWALQNIGQSGGATGADVNASGLWSIVSSAPKVVVAVLDSGMDFAHQDLIGVAWKNPGEIPGNAIDDDGNGHIDDVSGWDFVNSDSGADDDHDHGSHVTGIISARRNNGVGISGLADPVAILPVKILNSLNSGFTADLISALDYARLLGARVMNISLQNYPYNASLQSALDRAESAGIVLCICAGNQGANNDITPNYPSSFANANIIAIGNHDRTDMRWAGVTPSNYGLNSVDLFAPGRDVISTVRNNGYVVFTGTSMSCPHVTAVAAIIRALNPGWTPAEVKDCILQTVAARPAYNSICVTGGRLNAEAAINRAIKLKPANDPDGDGTPSLVEYGLGSDPLLGNSGGMPALHITGPTLEFTYTRPRADVAYSVEASDDFSTWDATIVNQGAAGTPVTATVPAGVTGQRFLRLKVMPWP